MTMEANNHKGMCACGGFVEKSKPYIAMICLQFGYAGMNIITKVSLNRGMSHYVLVVYRHAFATVALAPFALLFERKVRPKITLPIFIQMFVLGMLGPVIDQNFYYMGLKYTSPTFSCAMSNMLPAMTFIMAVICRMEKINMKRIPCQAKVVGTVVTVAGAMLMTLYKGEVINLFWTKYIHSAAVSNGAAAADKDWVMGSILLILATLAWAAFFILQAIVMKRYSAHLSLTTIVCFLGTLQSIAVTLVMEHKPDAWVIGFDMNLMAAAYAGIVSSGIAYYVQGLVMQKTGPVFVTSFSPLMMIIVAIMGSFILAENIYFGGVIGSVLIVCGLYAVLWGKHKESKQKEIQVEDIESIPEVIKQQQQDDDDDDEKRNWKIMPTIIEDIEANIIINGEEDDHQKSAAAKKEEEEKKKKIKYNNSTTTTLALMASMPQQLQMLAMEAPNYKGRPSSI